MHGRQAAEQQMHTKKYITQIGILNEYTDDKTQLPFIRILTKIMHIYCFFFCFEYIVNTCM